MGLCSRTLVARFGRYLRYQGDSPGHKCASYESTGNTISYISLVALCTGFVSPVFWKMFRKYESNAPFDLEGDSPMQIRKLRIRYWMGCHI